MINDGCEPTDRAVSMTEKRKSPSWRVSVMVKRQETEAETGATYERQPAVRWQVSLTPLPSRWLLPPGLLGVREVVSNSL